jgi:hypothetical protein
MGFNRILFLIVIISISGSTTAQILRVDKSHLESDSSGYFNCNADVSYSLDNRSISPSEKLVYTRLSSRLDMLYVGKNTAYILVNSIEYFKSSNATPFSTGYVHGRINFRRKHEVSYEVYGQIQYDGVRRMRLRELLGAGIRITLIDKPNVDVHMGTGVMYEWEKWREVEGDPSTDFYIHMPKASSYVGVEFNLTNHAQLTLWGLNQIGYDFDNELTRNRWAAEAALSIKITKRITWLNRFSYYYDVTPVIPINNAYFQLVNGLNLRF